MAEPGTDDSFVLLARAPNAVMVGLWRSMLEEAGIPCLVPGENLADGWAATQRMIGNVGTDVFVPRSRLDEARAAVFGEPIAPEPRAEEAEEIAEPIAASVAPAPQPLTRRQIVFEIVAITGMIVLPHYYASIAGLIERGLLPWEVGNSLDSNVWSIAWAVPQILLLRWAISRTGAPLASFGWVGVRFWSDLFAAMLILIGLIVFGVFFYGLFAPTAMSDSALTHFVFGTRERSSDVPSGGLGWGVAIAAMVAAAFVEELSIRGYLTVRLTDVTTRRRAIVIGSAVWAGAHLYQGLFPVAVHFMEGLFLAGLFFLLRRLAPLVIAHAGLNCILTGADVVFGGFD